MKMFKKPMVLTVLAAAMGLSASAVWADIASDAEALLNWAEKTYPTIFTVKKTTQTQGPWIFRHYVEAGIRAGVNKDDNKVYVMGGQWGNSPTVIGTLPQLMARVNANNGNNQVTACDTATLPAGMVMTQNGNVISISTGGKCIELPTDQSACDIPNPRPSKTGINVLSTTTLIKSELRGFTSSIPGITDSFLQSGNFSACVMNAPSEEYTNFTINMDVCYDLTNTFAKNGLTSMPPLLVITPPVTQLNQSSTTSSRVADCFATGAGSVTDLFTGEYWVKEQNGSYKKL